MILLKTTKISVQRPGASDPYEAPSMSTVHSGVDAHVSSVSGAGQRVGGAGERIDAQVYVDGQVTLQPGDLVTDAISGLTYTVLWSVARQGLGLRYRKAGLVSTRGNSNG